MNLTVNIKVALVAVATILAYFILGSDGSQQFHQLLLAGTVLFLGLAVVL